MVETAHIPAGSTLVPHRRAEEFATTLLRELGVPPMESSLVAQVLVEADVRGIRSHGLARIPYFLDRIERGSISANPEMTFSRRSDTTATLDARNGIGVIASDKAMDEAMGMADRHGSGFVVVKDSSHFGFAGFWAEKAKAAGFIGISLSNSGGRVAPTFGVEALLGTNPLAVAIPGRRTDFVLDMATSAVAVGKIETAIREGKPIPKGWMTSGSRPQLDERGILPFDAALLPLGGEGTESGGHKGYGLSLLVELLCGALGGTSFDARVAGASGEGRPAMGHFMGAIRVDGFRETDEVKEDMEETFDRLRSSQKVPGEDRIYIQGEPEAIAAERALVEGIVVTPPVMKSLEVWADRLGVERLTS